MTVDEQTDHAVTNPPLNFINRISYDPNVISLLESPKPKNNSKSQKSKKSSKSKKSKKHTILQCQFLLDSGASVSVVNDERFIRDVEYFPIDQRPTFGLADNSPITAIAKGRLIMYFGEHFLDIKDVYLIPHLPVNILSLKPFHDHEIPILFFDNGAFLLTFAFSNPKRLIEEVVKIANWDPNRNVYLMLGHYKLDSEETRNSTGNISILLELINQLDSTPEPRYATLYDFLNMDDLTDFQKDGLLHYHKKFGHASWTNLQQLIKQKIIDYKPTPDEIEAVKNCVSCKIATSTKASHNHAHDRCLRRLERVHSDTMGPFVVRMEKFYATTLIDDYSGYTEIIWSKSKSVALELLSIMQHWNTLFPEKISYFRADNAKELPTASQLSKLGIKRDDVASYTPQINGLSERTNRTILQYVRKAVQPLPARSIDLLPYLFKYAVHIKNLLPTARNTDSKPPFECFFEKPVNPQRAQPFGLDVIVDFSNDQEAKVNNQIPKKPEKNAVFGTLVGFGTDSNSYQVLLSLPGYRVITTPNVTFMNSFKVIVYYLAFINPFTFKDVQDNHKKLEELFERANDITPPSIFRPFNDIASLGNIPSSSRVDRPVTDHIDIPDDDMPELLPEHSSPPNPILTEEEDVIIPSPTSDFDNTPTTDGTDQPIRNNEITKLNRPPNDLLDNPRSRTIVEESLEPIPTPDSKDEDGLVPQSTDAGKNSVIDTPTDIPNTLTDVSSSFIDSPKQLRKRKNSDDDQSAADLPPRVSNPISSQGDNDVPTSVSNNALAQGDKQKPEKQFVRRRSARLSEKRLRVQSLITDDKDFDLTQPEWQAARDREYDSFVQLEVFEVVDIPKDRGTKLLPTRWVHSFKFNDQKEATYKARCVVQGFHQRKDIDYDSNQISSPVVRYGSIRYMVAIAVEKEWIIHHLDICTAYLNAHLNKLIPVYAKPPPGYELPKGKCWKLKKAVYGMKQAGFEWFVCLTDVLLKIGFIPTPALGVYMLKSKNDPEEQIIVALYVDDLFITASNPEKIKQFKDDLKGHFDLKYFGEVSEFFGTQFKTSESGYIIDQQAYVAELQKIVKLENGYTKSLPLPLSKRFSNSRGNNSAKIIDEAIEDIPTSPFCLEEQIKYFQQVVGSYMWLSTCTRPDISFAVNYLSSKNKSPTEDDLKVLEEPMRYLKKFPSLALHFKKDRFDYEAGTFKIETYVDASFANRETGRRSITGYAIFINRNLVDWRTKGQKNVTTSTNSAELTALRPAVVDTLMIRSFVEFLGFKISDTVIYEDNESVITECNNSRYYYLRTHVDNSLKLIQELIQNKLIRLEHVKSKENIADMFTKHVPIKEFESHRSHLLEESC